MPSKRLSNRLEEQVERLRNKWVPYASASRKMMWDRDFRQFVRMAQADPERPKPVTCDVTELMAKRPKISAEDF